MRSRSPLRLTTLLAALLLTAALPRPAAAWNPGGHMLAALLAWEQLNEPTRAWAIALLEQHPRFQHDFTDVMPPGLNAADRARWIFARAAAWPDVARDFKGEDRARYHHPTWHYGTMVLPLDARQPPATRPAGPGAGEVHVVEAIELAMRQLRDASVPAPEKAVSLCWLLHLIGDVHQPCHAGSLVAPNRFPLPEGDRGANGIPIAGEGRRNNLHSIWDGMITDSRELSVLTIRCEEMLLDPALSRAALRERTAHPSPGDWIVESADVARDAVYDFEVRGAIRLQEVDPKAEFQPLTLSRTYFADGTLVARRRMALAGQRIADTLGALTSTPSPSR
jgi:hypothetical protein